MKLKRILAAAIVATMTLGLFTLSSANAAGTYSISCKNDAYGVQLGGDYLDIAYVYRSTAAADIVVDADLADQYLIRGTAGIYVGNDCLYAGAGDTNGSAVVAGDVARLAVNAIVGAVSNRIDAAYAAAEKSASATGLSFTTQSDGISMAANKIVGGLSIWADYGSSSFGNTQAFTNARIDSMKYDGDSRAYSVGVDKTFGNALLGIVISNVDADLKTNFNDGTYKQNIDTFGVYLAYKTGRLQIDLGMGQGSSDIDTTRRDLGNDLIIVGKTTADVEYSNARISANFEAGRFTFVPSASYKTMSMDVKAFTDVRPDDTTALATGAQAIFSAGNATLTTTDDLIAARANESTEVGVALKITANLGRLTPYLEGSFMSEDTTSAVFKTELAQDSLDDLIVSKYSSSVRVGGGVNFILGSFVKGGIRAGTINSRDDWEENYVSGSIALGF